MATPHRDPTRTDAAREPEPRPAPTAADEEPRPVSRATDDELRFPTHEDAQSSEIPDARPEPQPSTEVMPEPASRREVASSREEADDDVHFGVAAKALGVSRKTVERMVKRGELERGPTGAPATVSKRGLVTVLDQRRRHVGPLTPATENGRAGTSDDYLTPSRPQPAADGWENFVSPLLRSLLDELVAARTRANLLEQKLESVLAAQAAEERTEEALLRMLATGDRRERREARRAAIRRYI